MEFIPLLIFIYIGYSIISRVAKAAKTPKNKAYLEHLKAKQQYRHAYSANRPLSDNQAGVGALQNQTVDTAQIAAHLNRLKKQQRRLSHKQKAGGQKGRRRPIFDANRSRRDDWGARESQFLSLGNLLAMVIAVAVIWLIIAGIAQG